MSDAARAKAKNHAEVTGQPWLEDALTDLLDEFVAEQTAALRHQLSETNALVGRQTSKLASAVSEKVAMRNRLNALLADPNHLTAELRGDEGLGGAYALACEENRKLNERIAALQARVRHDGSCAIIEHRYHARHQAAGPEPPCSCGLDTTDQTAALREENARLRGALEEEHRSNIMYRALPDPDGAWAAHESGDECGVCALLADPEGQ